MVRRIYFPNGDRFLPEDSFVAKYLQNQGEQFTYTELTPDTDIAALREQAANDPAVIANKRAQETARQRALQNIQQDDSINLEDEDTATNTTVTTADDIGQPTITSITTYIRDGRQYRLTIYSDGTSEEVDIGPANQNPPPQAPTLPILEGDPIEPFDIEEYARLNYTWMNQELLDTFLDIYNSNGGEADDAIRELRQTQSYKDQFPGIFRDDGVTLRLEGPTPELDYVTNVEAYKNYLADYNLNPDLFENKIVELFENDVAPRELQERLDTAYTLLFPQFDAVKRYYIENYPNVATSEDDITDESIFASFINEDISRDIIEQRIQISQVGGAFAEQNVDVSLSQAQRLLSAGVSSTLAQQLAAKAETNIPRLQRLAQKYRGDRNIFGTSEFLEAEVFGDSEARRLQEQLEAEEEALFSATGGTAITQQGVTGLEEI